MNRRDIIPYSTPAVIRGIRLVSEIMGGLLFFPSDPLQIWPDPLFVVNHYHSPAELLRGKSPFVIQPRVELGLFQDKGDWS